MSFEVWTIYPKPECCEMAKPKGEQEGHGVKKERDLLFPPYGFPRTPYFFQKRPWSFRIL